MSTLRVERPGMLTTVQDLGREGFGALGVSPSGAADRVALRVGNALVGNAPGAAALEMTLTGGTFGFSDGVAVALTGSDFGATLNGRPIELWCTHRVDAGEQLEVAATRSGARCYLCVSGGIDVPLVMGSASTHLLSGLGGFQGRALVKGDVLHLGIGTPPARPRRVAPGALEVLAPRKVLRVTRGSQFEVFSALARSAMLEGVFTVGEASNRMGLRLDGPLLDPGVHGEMISEGVPLGAIQVTPAGQAIVLFVEQQTAGGYPKIANVISADMHSVGQLRPRDEVRFEIIPLETARNLWMELEELLNSPDRLFT
jgi:antagonist of KipI